MKIISCNCCGVVLDLDKICFLDEDSDIWNGDEFIATTKCPVCKEVVREDGE